MGVKLGLLRWGRNSGWENRVLRRISWYKRGEVAGALEEIA
jgi:hypothetical protein